MAGAIATNVTVNAIPKPRTGLWQLLRFMLAVETADRCCIRFAHGYLNLAHRKCRKTRDRGPHELPSPRFETANITVSRAVLACDGNGVSVAWPIDTVRDSGVVTDC